MNCHWLLTTCLLALTGSLYAQNGSFQLSEEMSRRDVLRCSLEIRAGKFVESGIFADAENTVAEGFRTLHLDGKQPAEKAEEKNNDYLKAAIASLGDTAAVQDALAFVSKTTQSVSPRERYVNAAAKNDAERALLGRWEQVTTWVSAMAVLPSECPEPTRMPEEKIQETASVVIAGRDTKDLSVSVEADSAVLPNVDFSAKKPNDFLCVGYVAMVQTNILRI